MFVGINLWSEVLPMPDNLETFSTGSLEGSSACHLPLSPGTGISRKQVCQSQSSQSPHLPPGPISVQEKSPAMHRSVAEVSRITVAV